MCVHFVSRVKARSLNYFLANFEHVTVTISGTQASGGNPPDVAVWGVQDLLGRPELRIPDYQRPYAWTKRNVAQLVEDIQLFTRNGDYRIGTVILHRRSDQQEGEILDVVDGQQRLTTLHLLAHVLKNSGYGPGTGTVAPLQLSPYNAERTDARLRENHDFLVRLVADWGSDTFKSFADALFGQCEVVVVILRDLDEAFQMFDSQNARGRPLYPTDLLKAFHLREVGDAVRASRMREIVELWEDVPAAHVNALFSEYLFKIKRWSNSRPVGKEGFLAAHIGMFKGIREGDVDNEQNNWARAYVYAKNYTDDFRSENATAVRFGMMRPIEYPHQIDHPVLNGETFFRMVAHYYQLGVRLGLRAFDDDRLSEDLRATFGTLRSEMTKPVDEGWKPDGDPSRYAYIRALLDALLLYQQDRFGQQETGRFATLAARFAMVPRATHYAVKRETINNHALGTADKADGLNLFREIRDASTARELVNLTIPRPDLYGSGAGRQNQDEAVVNLLWGPPPRSGGT